MPLLSCKQDRPRAEQSCFRAESMLARRQLVFCLVLALMSVFHRATTSALRAARRWSAPACPASPLTHLRLQRLARPPRSLALLLQSAEELLIWPL